MLKLSVGKKRLALFVLAGWVLLMASNQVDELRLYQGAFVATYALGITSIILLTGYSGQLSLGHSALMAVGAYAGALTTNNLHWHPAIALVMAALIAGLFGLLLGLAVARLSGPYLAGTTLALAVSLPTLANQFPILGGEQGLIFDVGVAPARFGEEFSQYKWFFWIAALATLIMIWTIANISSTRYGRTFRALRDNPIAAELAGVNVGLHKVIAFTVSAGVAGLAGGLLVMLVTGVSPSAFPLSLSFSLLTGAVVTGVYNLKGVILGALVLVAIPEIADSVVSRIGGSEGFATTLPGLLVSALLILAVLFAPNGPGELLKKRLHK
ncbi:MAG: branched-chain amino acid ABC transporter permease [Actinomycetes bacterium]